MKKLASIGLLALLPVSVFGQFVVKGRVTDAKTKEALGGCNVLVAGTTVGTSTALDGAYTLTVPDNYPNDFTLVVSYLGYKTVKVAMSKGSAREVKQDFALTEDALQLSGIAVTARKQVETAQEVPISLSALSSEQIRRTGAAEFRDYASSIANLSFGTKGTGAGSAFGDGRTSNQITIRGIAGSSTTSFYLDETPLPENIDPRLVDVARVEVLRGPQGTLYGSRAMGGAVKVVTNAPGLGRTQGSFSITSAAVKEGDFDYDLEGVLNVPLVTNKLAFRGTGFYQFESGVFDRVVPAGVNILNSGATLDHDVAGNPITIPTDGCASCDLNNKENLDDEKNYGFQASLGWQPSKNVFIVPKVIYQNQKGEGYDFADNRAENFTQVRQSGVEEFFKDKWGHYSLTASANFAKGELISSTSFLNRDYIEQEDEGEFISGAILEYPNSGLGFWAGVIDRAANYKRFVQELRFHSNFKSRFNFVAGLFYSDESLDEEGNSKKPGLIRFLVNPDDPDAASFLDTIQWWHFENVADIQELALFGEAYVDLSDRLKLTLGLRFFDAKSDRNITAAGAPVDYVDQQAGSVVNESGINPKINLTLNIDENRLVYASASKGFRLGGINNFIPINFCRDELASLPGGNFPAAFKSDHIWSYELGLKQTLAGGRVIANAAAFYNNWSNLQQFRFFPTCGFGFTSNVGAANSKGFEADLQAKLSRNFELGGGIGVVDASIDETGPGIEAEPGDKILFTADLTANANVQYTTDLSNSTQLYVRGDLQYAGERTSSFAPESNPARVFAPYTLVNARVGLVFPAYSLSFFVNNLTNEAANFGDITSLAAEAPGRVRYATNRPRTAGIQLGVNF
jgi:outer membrane receptor protein involved in Fe transport